MNDRKDYDLIVIGSGPGGYVAAVRAAQLGMKTACVEKESRLGGVCLNAGCIPSKALLDSSEYFYLAKQRFKEHGIGFSSLDVDISKLMERKKDIVKGLTEDVKRLLQRNRVTIVKGRARLAGEGRVDVRGDTGEKTAIYAEKILLATGSEPVFPPSFVYDKKRIVSSTEALSFDHIPESLGIVGGGYVGLELGSVWQRLGSRVTIIEMLPHIAPSMDGQVARTLERSLKKQGINFMLKSMVTRAVVSDTGVEVEIKKGDESASIVFDRLLVAVGRRPLTRGLGCEELGMSMDEKTGHILVDENYQTSIRGIFAVGDLIHGPALAHKASAEGTAAVEIMAGKTGKVNYDAIPSIVYTEPEAAGVGLTVEEAKRRQIPFCTGTYPFRGSGRARCLGDTEGFVKIVVHSQTGRILGAHIIGPRASELIAECVLAMEFSAGFEDIARTVHGHPTFSEAIMEAARNARAC